MSAVEPVADNVAPPEPEAAPPPLPARPIPRVDPLMLRLHPDVKKTWWIDLAITAVVFLIIFSIIDLAVFWRQDWYPLPPMVGALGLISLFLLLQLVYNAKRYARWGYQVRELDVVIESGVWWRTRRCVPRARVQHVDIASGPIDRSLGLVNVELFVAGGIGAVASIPGLSPHAAEALREALVGQSAEPV
jgi:membrane protein YdbS with pleckstrin-like domain